MAKIKIKFTEDHIKLISNLRFQKIEPKYEISSSDSEVFDIENVGNGRFNIQTRKYNEANLEEENIIPVDIHTFEDYGDNLYGIDTYNLWGGTYIFEDMAYILGKMDKVIEGTMEDPDGPKFDEETTEYLNETASFIISNLENIEEILHQFCIEGIQVGVVYTSRQGSHIWKKEEKEE